MAMQKRISVFWANLIRFQLKNRLLILVLISALTLLSGYFMVKSLEIKTDFFELYPPNHEYIKLYKEFRKMFGSANVLTIILEREDGKDIYNPVTLKKVNELTLGILKIKGCNPIQVSSISHPRVKKLELSYQGISMLPLMWPKVPETSAASEKFKKTVYSNKGIRGFYISLDNKSTAIYAGFWEEGVDLLNLFKEVHKLTSSIEDENHKCYIAGYPMLYAWVNHYRHQVYIILCITAGAMIFLLIFYFKNIHGVAIPVVSAIVSALWGLGFASVLGINIDPLLLVVPVLLSARALSHSCQCLERFHQEYAECRNKDEAIITAYSALYPPAILAIITDGLGVLTIAIATIPLMQKLAYFSSFWIISIFVAVMILNPIIISFFYTPSLEKVAKKTEHTDIANLEKKNIYILFLRAIYRMSGRRTKWITTGAAFVLIFVGGYYTTHYLKVGDSSAGGAILYPDHPYNIAMQKMNSNFAGASRLVVVLEGKEKGAMKARESLKILEDLAWFMKEYVQNVGGTLSLADLVRKVYSMYHEGYPKWDMIPKSEMSLEQIFFLLSASMATGEMDQFVSLPDYTNSNVTAFLRDYDHESIKEAIAKLTEFKEAVAADPDSKINIRLAAGILGILAAVNDEVEWSYWATLIVIFITTFILCSITYRSFKAAIILLVPLAVSQVLCEIIMLIFHIPLNIDSLPVTAIGVGVGIDYGIYLMSRLKEECLLTDDFDKARMIALSTTGRVIMFTALTLAIGVGFWVFSTMKFSAEMGLLILLLMVFNMVSALVLIPAFSGIIKPVFVKNMGKGVALELK